MSFIRYIIIQLLAYVVDMGSFLIVLKLGVLGSVAANVVGKVAAGVFAFIAHRNITFRANDSASRSAQAVRYFLLLAINVPLSSCTLAIMLVFVRHPVIAKIAADVMCVALSYWLSKSFVFKRQTSMPQVPRDSEVE